MVGSRASFAADRVAGLTMSAIKGMAILAASVPDVAPLTWGVPSFQTPENINNEYCFDNADAYYNLASAKEFADTIAYLFTFSKCHAMSGWRLGYAVVPEDIKQQMLKVHDAMMICAPRPSQIAGIAALAGEQAHVPEFRNMLMQRRELICARLDRVPHVFSYVRPQGAYYVFPRIELEYANSEEFSVDLLETGRVCVTPGSAFGPSGEGHVRMAFCVGENEINTAFDRIEGRFGREG